MNSRLERRAWTPWAAGATIGGAALFIWTIRSTGTGAVFGGIGQLGAGFIVVLSLGGLRYLCRAAAWLLAIEPPRALTLRAALAAVIAGDAIGNITPLGLLVSEPSKIFLVGRTIEPAAAVAGLAIENLLYSATVVVMLVGGTLALLTVFHADGMIRAAAFATLAAAVLVSSCAIWIAAVNPRILSRTCDRLTTWNRARRYAGQLRSHAVDLEDRVQPFLHGRSDRIAAATAFELAYHIAAVAEIWITVALMTGRPPGALAAFVLEYVNRTITIAFQFVPMWLGVDEAGTGLAARALQMSAATGVSLALVRKARIVVWTVVGLVLLVRQGVRRQGAARRSDAVADRPGRLTI